ncbi:argininosuccinate lyase, partial [Sulfolobus sp. B5]
IKMKAVIGSPNFDLITNLIKIREDKLHEDVKKLESYNMNINSKLGELRVLEDEIEQGS